MRHDIYLYGMILQSTSFLLQGDFPLPDSYGEIREKYTLTGGETGTCATILANLGCRVKMDGNYLGTKTLERIMRFYIERGVDITRLTYDKTFDGLEDYIIIDKNTRTCFGNFGEFFSNEKKRWNIPKREDIEAAKVAGIDPFIEDSARLAAGFCHEAHVPYVTLDCPYDSELNRYASVNALSNEYVNSIYKDADREELIKKYAENSDGLIIFTHGAQELLYARRGGEVGRMPACKAEVVSTLGAGDTFKAGCVYALLKGMRDEQIVRFASAAAAVAISCFPIPLNPPSLNEIEKMIALQI